MQKTLYPPIEPYAHEMFSVSDIHTLYIEQCGNPDGVPVVFIHGGPGGGCSAKDRQFFDPNYYRIVLIDQRGSLRSTPLGEVRENHQDHLVSDMEKVREHLGIDKWHVFGGSWGSTLSIYYAQCHPERTLSLTLRGIFLFRQFELDAFMQPDGSIARIFPEAWERLTNFLPEEERSNVFEAYYKRIQGDDREVAEAAAFEWTLYEVRCCSLVPNDEALAAMSPDDLSYGLGRMETHYFKHNKFEPEDKLLRDIDTIAHIPTTIVQGRYDTVCPVQSAYSLSREWPEARFIIVPHGAHASRDAGMTHELVCAMDRIRDAVH